MIRVIHFSTIVALCKALNCEPGDLLEIEAEAT
ncbi:MAG: helix-turn-helix domain-containing protein [Pseudomonadales bacterium]|nr:helix-turn-helix domain-containing protein [Pseudomonadales bacterium]